MRFLLALAATLTLVTTLTAAKKLPDPWDNYDEALFMDMDLDQNIETPRLDRSEQHYIRNFMRGIASELAKKKYIVDLDRNDEVVVVTLPTDELFLPNDTLLSPRYGKFLDPLKGYLRDPSTFKLVYVVHTDNTGSADYNMDLSQERVNTIYDWLLDNANEDMVIIPFAMGDSDPIENNNTRTGRAANRRVELYFIPGPDLILRARK